METLNTLLQDLEQEWDQEVLSLCLMELEDNYRDHLGYNKALMVFKQCYKFGNLSNTRLRLIKDALSLYKV